MYINLADLGTQQPQQMISVQNDGKAIMLTSKATPVLKMKSESRNAQINSTARS